MRANEVKKALKERCDQIERKMENHKPKYIEKDILDLIYKVIEAMEVK